MVNGSGFFFLIIIFNTAGNLGYMYPAENHNEKMCATTGPGV